MLQRRQARKLIPRHVEELAHLVVNVRAIGERWQLLAAQELRDVRLGHVGRGCEIALAEGELFQALANEKDEIHDLTRMIIRPVNYFDNVRKLYYSGQVSVQSSSDGQRNLNQ